MLKMAIDPVDHLLMTLYTMYQWGEPAENSSRNGIPHSAETHARNAGLAEEPLPAWPKHGFKEVECPLMMQIEADKLPDNLFGLLGEYQVKSYDTEGTFFLYKSCINKIGELFHNSLGEEVGMKQNYCVDLVREIVIWHELGYWITHWMPGKDHHRWNSKSYRYDEKSIEVHEALAMAFVQFAILHIEYDNRRNHYQILFHFMLDNQQKLYYLYNQLLKHPRFGWNTLLGGITMLRLLENPDEVTFEYLLNNLTAI